MLAGGQGGRGDSGKLVDRELAHEGLNELLVVETMRRRRHELSDAYSLPGGIGTMEEFSEAVTWRQLDYHAKPIALLNVDGFYDSIEQFFDTMISTGFLRAPRSCFSPRPIQTGCSISWGVRERKIECLVGIE